MTGNGHLTLLALRGLVALALLVGCEDDRPQAGTPGTGPMTGVDAGTAPGDVRSSLCLTVVFHGNARSRLLAEGGIGGVDYFAEVLRQARVDQADGRCADRAPGDVTAMRLTLSTGNTLGASAELEASLRAIEANATAPIFDGLVTRALDYDAVLVGPSDLDYGPELLARFLAEVRDARTDPRVPFPFLITSLDVSAEPLLADLATADEPPPDADDAAVPEDDRALFPHALVAGDDGWVVGIVGAVRPDLARVTSPRGVLAADDPEALAATVQAEIDAVRDAGANLVVLMTQLADDGGDGATVPAADRALVRNLSGVGLVVSGSRELLVGQLNVVPPEDTPTTTDPILLLDADGAVVPAVATVGAHRWVGRFGGLFDTSGRWTNRVDEGFGPIRVEEGAVAEPPQDEALQRTVVAPVEDLLVGNARVAESEVELDARAAALRDNETNAGNLVADAVLHQAGEIQQISRWEAEVPDVAVVPGGRLGAGVEGGTIGAGNVDEGDLLDLVEGYDALLATSGAMSRADFKALLEHAVSDVEDGGARFLQIAGFDLVFDPAADAGSRVAAVTLDGGVTVVEDGRVVAGGDVNVAAPLEVLDGSAGYPVPERLVYVNLGTSVRYAVRRYVVDPGGLAGTIEDGTGDGEYAEGGDGRIRRVPP